MYFPIFNLIIVAWGIFFFVLILSTPYERSLAKYMLLAFIAVQMHTPLQVFIPQSQQGAPGYLSFQGNLFYLSGPTFYFYIKALRSPTFRFQLRHLWCVLPLFIMPLFFVVFLQHFEGKLPLHSVHLLLQVTWFLAFLIAGLRLLPGNWWLWQELFAHKKDTIWRWLYMPTLFYIGVYLLRLVQHFVEIITFSSEQAWSLSYTYIPTLLTRVVFLYLVAIGSYRHRDVYEQQEEEPLGQDESGVEAEGGGKYNKSPLDEQQVQVIWQKLNAYMSEDEPFRELGLQRAQLARELGITVNSLSQVVNTCAGQNFHDFINQYRVEKARNLIQEYADSRRTMLDLSLEAGFGNTGTFYKYFKKHFAVTPVQFRNSCRKR